MDRAACLGSNPEVFFTKKSGNGARKEIAKAASICARCPVRQDCRDYATALPATSGVWGGWPVGS